MSVSPRVHPASALGQPSPREWCHAPCSRKGDKHGGIVRFLPAQPEHVALDDHTVQGAAKTGIGVLRSLDGQVPIINLKCATWSNPQRKRGEQHLRQGSTAMSAILALALCVSRPPSSRSGRGIRKNSCFLAQLRDVSFPDAPISSRKEKRASDIDWNALLIP